MKRNYTIVILILIAFFTISFLTNILGALNPAVSDSFKLNETMAGFLPFAFFIAYGIMSIPSGLLVEKYGEKRLMLVAFGLACFASILFAGIPRFEVFVFSLFAIGTGMAVLQVVINPLLRVSGGEENYAFTSVLAQLVFGAASFLSPRVFSWLVSGLNGNNPTCKVFNLIQVITPEKMDWVSMYILFALMSIVMVALILSIKFPNVKLNNNEKTGSKESYIALFKKPIVILYFLGIFAYVGLEQGISYWMSKYLQIYHNFDANTVGAKAVGNFWGLMTIGGIVGLGLLKIMDSKLVLRIFTLLAIVSLGLALFLPAHVSVISFQIAGFFLSVMYPVILSLALNSVKRHHGSFAGILMTGIMGGAVIQLVIGFISDNFSLQVGMALNFVCLIYILSISFWANPLIKNQTIKLNNIKQNK